MPAMIQGHTLPTISRTMSVGLDAIDDRKMFSWKIGGARPNVTNPILKPMLQMQTANDPAGDDRNGEAEGEIGERNLPAEQAEQKSQRYLVHHRCRDQE